MDNLTISTFIKVLMPALNSDNTQEAVFGMLFGLLYDESDSTTISSKKVSNIMNEKEDIPEIIRQLANRPVDSEQSAMKENIIENICVQIIPRLREPLKEDLAYNYSKLIEADNDISPKKKEYLLRIIYCGNEEKYLPELFLYVVNVPFRKTDEFREILYCSSVLQYSENDNMLSKVKAQYGKYIDLDKRKANKVIAHELYKLTTICSFDSEFIRGSYFSKLEFEYNGNRYAASTSCSNWLSQSKLDNILCAGTTTVTLIFKVINNDAEKVQVLLIGELN